MYQILVVEDSVDIYEGLSSILREEGFDVTVADTQRSATAALEQEDADFDLALVDLSLPDGHGFAVFQTAQQYNVPVIFLTANDDGVAGVVAAVRFHNIIDLATEDIGSLALAFVAPLGADDDDRSH